MRRTIGIWLALLVAPLAMAEHHHDDEAHRAAHLLVDAIQKLEKSAFEQADNMAEDHLDRGVRELDRVSDAANLLERTLRRQVLREMHDLDGHDRFGRTLNAIEAREYRDLQIALEDLNRAGAGIHFEIVDVEQAWRGFERTLRPFPSQVSATCNGKFGGNFFNKSSHVECTINGAGLTRYEVEFSNPQVGAQQSVQGSLDGRQRQQSITSSKVSVGRNANYTVYVVNFRGERIQVAQGVCQGNPF